jgi:hypothetical protein
MDATNTPSDQPHFLTQAEVERLILDHEAARYRSYVSALEERTIVEIIKSLTPDKELGHGKTYLLALLKKKGRFGLERFLDKALEAMGEEGKLDIARNFDGDEQRLFEELFLGSRSSHVIPQSLSRRQFISKAGRYASAAFVVEATIPPLAHLAGIKKDEPETSSARRNLQVANELTEYAIGPTGLLAIAAHIHNDEEVETLRIRLENITQKLSHIEWAVDELAKESKRHQRINGFGRMHEDRGR